MLQAKDVDGGPLCSWEPTGNKLGTSRHVSNHKLVVAISASKQLEVIPRLINTHADFFLYLITFHL